MRAVILASALACPGVLATSATAQRARDVNLVPAGMHTHFTFSNTAFGQRFVQSQSNIAGAGFLLGGIGELVYEFELWGGGLLLAHGTRTHTFTSGVEWVDVFWEALGVKSGSPLHFFITPLSMPVTPVFGPWNPHGGEMYKGRGQPVDPDDRGNLGEAFAMRSYYDTTVTPEPAGLLLALPGLGIIALIACKRRLKGDAVPTLN